MTRSLTVPPGAALALELLGEAVQLVLIDRNAGNQGHGLALASLGLAADADDAVAGRDGIRLQCRTNTLCRRPAAGRTHPPLYGRIDDPIASIVRHWSMLHRAK